MPAAVLATDAVVALLDPDPLEAVAATGWATLDAK
jgi:hypothetical protein